MSEEKGKTLSIEIRAGAGFHPDLLDVLIGQIEDMLKDLLIMAGIGFELDSLYTMEDKSIDERAEELEEQGRLVMKTSPPYNNMDINYLMASTPDISFVVVRDSQ